MQLTVDSGQLIVIQLAVQFGSADTAVPLRGYGCGQNQLGLKLQGVGRLLILLLTTAIDAVRLRGPCPSATLWGRVVEGHRKLWWAVPHPTKKLASSTCDHTHNK